MTSAGSRQRVFIVLLRAVNVGGTKKIAMAALRDSLAALGLCDVRTYLQSGNAVLRTDRGTAPADLAADIHARIAQDFGHDVDVLVLTADDLRAVIAGNAFALPDADVKPLHATFLFAHGGSEQRAALAPPAADGEEWSLGDGVVYLRLPYGYGRTKLTNAYFERALPATATTRNWRTVLALAEMSEELR